MNYFLRGVLLVKLSLACASLSYAQSNCAVILRNARATYDQGRLHELPEMLESCLKTGFTRQERVEAYKLLVLSYIYQEEPAKADQTMLELLRTDPYFELNEQADAAEFAALYKTFRTWPVYRWGAKVGVNATQPHVISQVNAVDGAVVEYTPTINFQAGLVAEIPLNAKLTLNPELGFQIRSFYYDNDLDLTGDLENTSEGQETQGWLSLPVSVQYALGKSKLHPYVSLGVSADYLLFAQLNMNRFRVNATSTREGNFDITDDREKWNLNAIAGAGIKMKLGSGFVVTELRFHYGLRPTNNTTSTFDLDDYLLWDHGYADNKIRINSMSLTAGYVYNVFHPKKLRSGK